MGKRKLIKNARDVDRILDAAECERRNCKGSHAVAYLPNGRVLTYHRHGDYRPGMRRKIEKVLLAAGLLAGLIGFGLVALAVEVI